MYSGRKNKRRARVFVVLLVSFEDPGEHKVKDCLCFNDKGASSQGDELLDTSTI